MDLRSFQCVITLADEEHFGRAADRLHITQPALSQRIAALEDEVGHALFIRTRGAIKPTRAGEALIRRAHVVLANAEAAKADAKLAATGLIGRLRIGFTQIILYQAFPELLTRFRKAYPDIEIELQELISPKQEQALIDGHIDVGLIHPPLIHKELQFRSLEPIKLIMAMPESWPQSKLPSITLSGCAEMPLILPPRYIGPIFYDGIISACNRAGFSPNIVQEAIMSTLIGLVSAGVGAGFVAEGFSVIKRPNVVYIPVDGDLPTLPVAAAWQPDVVNPAVNRFLDILSEKAN